MLERFWFGCGHCDGSGAACPFGEQMEAAQQTPAAGVARLPLPLTAMAVFLLPLASALGGSYLGSELWAGDSFASVSLWQAGGMLAGLAVGAGLARLLLAGLYRIWTYRSRGGE
jgi:hypothetical protein